MALNVSNWYSQGFSYNYIDDINIYGGNDFDKNSEETKQMIEISKALFDKYLNKDFSGGKDFFQSGDEVSKLYHLK